MKPLISVIMPVHNGSHYLKEAVKGILNQSYRNFELIAVDDASSDDSLKILEDYSKKDNRIRVIRNRNNIGLTKSLIKAISSAKGEYLARHDADDISLPQRLEKQVSFLEHNPSYGAIGTSAEIVDKEGRFIKNALVPKSWFVIEKLLYFGNCFLHGSMMFRFNDYLKAGGYRGAFSLGQDYDLWLRISRIKKMKNLQERLYLWRKTEENISSMKTDPQFKTGALALYDHRYNKRLELTEDFEIDHFISSLDSRERKKYDLCLRDLCLRHGNISMAKEYVNHGVVNIVFIILAEIAFNIIRMRRR